MTGSKTRIAALARTDLRVAARDGEQLLLTLGLPVLLLVFFSRVDVLPTGKADAITFLTPGIITLALLSVAFVRQAIGIGFDRGFGAIKRLAVTPLGVGEFLVAKVATTVLLFVLQLTILVGLGLVLGWQPELSPTVIPALLLGLVAFSGLAFVVASVVEGLTALAVANTLYILLLLLSGLVFDLEKMPDWLAFSVKFLPSTALASLLRAGFNNTGGPDWAWLCLGLWSVTAPLLATRLFRWE